MKKSKKKVEFLSVRLNSEEDYDFGEILKSKDVLEREFKIKSKQISLKILKSTKDFLIGIVETTRDENIPPKKNKKSKIITNIGLAEGDGLAYANIFLYEKRRGILLYEVNKFGCFIDHFIIYIYRSCKGSKIYKEFNLDFEPILNADQYKRMLNMVFYKSIELTVTNPSEIIEEYQLKNDSFINLCKSATDLGSTKITAIFDSSIKNDSLGLFSMSLKNIVDRVKNIISGRLGQNIEKVIVKGYETDDENEKMLPVDLIADRYIGTIELEEPRENIDLLESQRVNQILALYENSKTDLAIIIGK